MTPIVCTHPGCNSRNINPGVDGRGQEHPHLCDTHYWKQLWRDERGSLVERIDMLATMYDGSKRRASNLVKEVEELRDLLRKALPDVSSPPLAARIEDALEIDR